MTARYRDWLRHVLARAFDATHLPVAFYLFYAGVRTVVDGPSPLVSTLPSWLTYAWATALIVGALLTTVGTLADRNRLESSGHGFHLFGLGLYALTAFVAIGFSGSVVVVIFALGGVSASRLHVLHRSRTAKHVATRIVNGES
jgi:hypothetical protein